MSWSRYDVELYPIVGLHRGMNRLFNRVFSDLGMEPSHANSDETRTFSPGLAFSDNEKEILITLEVPGMSENDVNISLGKDTLTISGEKAFLEIAGEVRGKEMPVGKGVNTPQGH